MHSLLQIPGYATGHNCTVDVSNFLSQNLDCWHDIGCTVISGTCTECWCIAFILVIERVCIALHGNPSKSYGASPAICDHTVLPATRHR